jgi:hypothetical protein
MAVATFIGTHSQSIPFKTTNNRPGAIAGDLRFNIDTNNMELYNGKMWTVIVDEVATDTSSKLEITTGEEKFGDCHYWVQVTVPGLFSERRQKNIEIDEWVTQTYGPKSTWGYGRWTGADERYWFKEEKDRSWFVLKWTE